MANPIIKIKKNISDESIISGLTAGELFVNLVTNALYARGESTTVHICGEIDTDPNLTSNSGYKIPTQKAIKTYIDNIPQISVNELEERNSVATQSAGSSTTIANKITFGNIILDQITGLTYSAGNFTNISGQDAVYNVSYKIAIRTLTNITGRYSYILKSNGEKYGSTTKLPSLSGIAGNTGMIIEGNATFKLSNTQSFSLNLLQDAGFSLVTGGSAGLGNIFDNRISIYRLS